MSAAFSQASTKLRKYGVSFLFWLLFAYWTLVAFLGVREFFVSKGGYPFARHIGWNYCSKITYEAVNLDHTYLAFLQIVTACLFFRLGKEKPQYALVAIAILAARLIYSWLMHDYYPGIWQT